MKRLGAVLIVLGLVVCAAGPSVARPPQIPDLVGALLERVDDTRLGDTINPIAMHVLRLEQSDFELQSLDESDIAERLKRAQDLFVYWRFLSTNFYDPAAPPELARLTTPSLSSTTEDLHVARSLQVHYPMRDVLVLAAATHNAAISVFHDGDEQSNPAPYQPGQTLSVGPNGHVNLGYDPAGFTEAGILTERIGQDDVARCTAALVQANIILTASHCIANRQGDSGIAYLSNLAFFPQGVAGTDVFYTRRWIDPGLHGSEKGTIRRTGQRLSLRTITPYIQNPPDFDTLVHIDLTLAIVSSAPSSSAPPASLFPLAQRRLVTVAGYGNSGFGQGERGEKLRVGWLYAYQMGSDIVWDGGGSNAASSLSGVCNGDSGGPIYNGVVQGRTQNEVRAVVGVTHQIDCTSNNLRIYANFQTFLTETHLDWIRSFAAAHPH